jgi:hypothetical protein
MSDGKWLDELAQSSERAMRAKYPADGFDSPDGRTYSGPVTAATPGQAAEPEIPVHLVQLWLCDLCLDGEGDECHTPGCSLWIHDVPKPALRGSQGVTILGPALEPFMTPEQLAAQDARPAPELAECGCPETDGKIYHQRGTCTDPVAAKLDWYADAGRIAAAPAPELAAAMAVLRRVLEWFPTGGTRNEASATRAQLASAYLDGGLNVPEELRKFLGKRGGQ